MKVKRSPNLTIRTKTQRDTTVYVKASTPFVSALKRIDGILEKFEKLGHPGKSKNKEYKNVKYVVIKGMGKSIQKTTALALHYKTKNHAIDVYTGTVEVVDTVSSGDVIVTREGIEEQTKSQLRSVSYVEARIWLKLR